MKILSLNCNGIRAAIKKGLFFELSKVDPDVILLQEVRAEPSQWDRTELLKTHPFIWESVALSKGYAGVLVASKFPASHHSDQMGSQKHTEEGRWCEVHFDKLVVVSAYFPSGSSSESAQESKMEFLTRLKAYLSAELPKWKSQNKSICIGTDANVARENIDICNWSGNIEKPGFTKAERAVFESILGLGLQDVYRQQHPSAATYTWWSQRGGARSRNVGWRIDYQLVSSEHAGGASVDIIKNPVVSDHAMLVGNYPQMVLS